jgi:DNA invertase Pin-like site-specific DNA recombinase
MAEKTVQAEGLQVAKWNGEKKSERKEVELKRADVVKLNELGSMSDKIRMLDGLGLSKGEIAGVLGIRFNWVYNVLRHGSGNANVGRKVEVKIVD